MKLVFMQKLDPIKESKPRGDGVHDVYDTFTSRYEETTVAVDLDAFVEAFEVCLSYKKSLYATPQQLLCLDISFSKGDRSPSYLITYAEFKRIFKREFGSQKEKHDH